MIAMALAADPELLIADEPTTALDVTVQAQILDLFRRLRDRRGMALLLVTHDLGVVAELADRVAVMRQGRVVEAGRTRQVLDDPQHGYTRELLAATSRSTTRRGGRGGAPDEGRSLSSTPFLISLSACGRSGVREDGPGRRPRPRRNSPQRSGARPRPPAGEQSDGRSEASDDRALLVLDSPGAALRPRA